MGALLRFGFVAATAALLSSVAVAEPISDTFTITIGNFTDTKTAPEVKVGGVETGESKLAISLANVQGFVGTPGYVLICEPPMDPKKGCGPNNKFKGVSDIIVRGILATDKSNTFFLFSDPFSDPATNPNGVNDATSTLKLLYGNTIPNPLGPITGILETGKAQPLGTYFGFKLDNTGPNFANAVVLTSDLDAPEPATISLLAAAISLAGMLRLKRRPRA
jgi:hypothetical protein